MSESPHIVFAGGGTGGHLFPGLAVADELVRRWPSAQVTFCGTGKKWERDQVARSGYAYCSLTAAPFMPSPLGMVRALYHNTIGYRAACRLLSASRPDVVVGLGGFSSVPISLAAARLGIPLLLLEQNVVPGRANWLLARFASRICTAFERSATHLRGIGFQPFGTRGTGFQPVGGIGFQPVNLNGIGFQPATAHPSSFLGKSAIVCTGNPVRGSIVRARSVLPLDREAPSPTLLILGGSQGSQNLNRYVAAAIRALASQLKEWRIVHQTGGKDEGLNELYSATGLHAEVRPFFDDMAEVYTRASLAICRAGATTLAELAVMGVPPILVPYPFAGNHQKYNAEAFARVGAALVVPDRAEPGLSAKRLTAALGSLLRSASQRDAMRHAMMSLARPDATATVSDLIVDLALSRVRRSAA